jgi:hypothetical protein
MADILIRGMAMPENCIHCRFAVDGWCYAYCKPNIPALEKAEVSNFCPLVPLPEGHGRLIDGDRFRFILCRLMDRQDDDSAIHALRWAIECLDKLESLVDAEGGGNADG